MKGFDVDEGLKRLGYAGCWLDTGVLSLETLEMQLHRLAEADADQSIEHYRSAALRDYLAARAKFTESELDGLLSIARAELGGPLRGHVFHELIRHEGLNDHQFARVSGGWDGVAFRRVVLRRSLLRALWAGNPAPSLLDRCQNQGDAVVHQALLGLEVIGRGRMLWLSEHGANRAVRAAANARLRGGSS